MYIYFPQWQGAGPKGISMKTGAETVLQHLGSGADKFVKVGISKIPVDPDPDTNPHSHIHCYQALIEQLRRFRELLETKQPANVNTLGGDCGVEIIPVSYLNRRIKMSGNGKLGVLWFDAHTDINLPEESPSGNFHGMPVRTLLGEGATEMVDLMFSTLDPEQVVYVGTRDLDPPEKQYIAEKQIKLFPLLDIAALKSTLKDKGVTHVYVHLDLDCLDPPEYAHTYYKVQGGLSIADVHAALHMLDETFEIVGSSLLESVASEAMGLRAIEPLISFFANGRTSEEASGIGE